MRAVSPDLAHSSKDKNDVETSVVEPDSNLRSKISRWVQRWLFCFLGGSAFWI